MLLRALAVAGSLVVFAAAVWTAAAHPANQWDFRTYYRAAKAQQAGANPYDSASLRDPDGAPERGPGYTYAPHTLHYFRPLTALDQRTAAIGFLGAKCLLLVVLLVIWRTCFLREQFNLWFIPFAVLAFNGATCADLVSGNVQLFELTLLWLAFACYVREWDLPFGLLVVAAASLRLWPVMFLGLYLMRGRVGYATAFAGAFVALLVASRAPNPAAFAGFIQNAIALREDGWNSPALWPLIQSVRGYIAHVFDIQPPNWPAVVVYAVIALAVLVVTVRVGGSQADASVQVYLACCAYVLVVPHLRPSGYMLLLVPAFHLLRTAPPLHACIALGLMAVLPANPATGLPHLAPLGVIVGEYYLWLTAAVFWGLYVYHYWTELPDEFDEPPLLAGGPEPPPPGPQ